MVWTPERVAALHERVNRARRDAAALRGELSRGSWPLGDPLDQIEESLPAQSATVPRVRRAVIELAERAGASKEQLDRIRLAVSEAVTNVVRHAYRDQPGQVHVTAAVISGELTVLIADDGCGPRVPAAEPGLGWGWKLLAQISDSFTIAQRGTGGTETSLRFQLTRESGRDGQPRGSDSSAIPPASPRFSTTT